MTTSQTWLILRRRRRRRTRRPRPRRPSHPPGQTRRDKYYQTPRFWLVGYAEDRSLLQPEKSLEDVSSEHAQKTITIDPHPHLNLSAASIHPCRHASVMKKIMAQMGEGGDETAVEHYMLIFLKFIASIVPTIEYDYTLSA